MTFQTNFVQPYPAFIVNILWRSKNILNRNLTYNVVRINHEMFEAAVQKEVMDGGV